MADAIGLVALSLTLLNGSVKGLALLSKASHYSDDISNVQLQLELELHSLWNWAETAGLLQERPTLYISARDAPFVPKILKQQEALLTDLDQIKRRYGLELKTTSDNLEILDDDNSTLKKLGPKLQGFLGTIQSSLNPNKVGGPLKKLRWVTLDEQKLVRLLQDVSSYTTRLEKFLESSLLERRVGDLDSILREAVLNVNDDRKLSIIGRQHEDPSSESALAASARLKQTMLKLGLSASDPNLVASSSGTDLSTARPSSSHLGNGVSTSMRLHMSNLTISSNARGHTCIRHLAFYKSQAVVLEWRHASQMNSGTIERRVDKVAAFLHELEPSFHSLPCLGYVKDHELNRYGYVFNLPKMLQPILGGATKITTPSSPSSSKPDMRSLYNLFEDPTVPKPSLNLRMSIAKTLVETLLNLHTAGWFHKELRSENIILIQESKHSTSGSTNISNFSVYVAGYIYARTQDPGEMTEPLRSDVEADLYRHPSSLGQSRLPFRKSFDIFTVACVLLEIGLWMKLRDVLKQDASKQISSGPDGCASTNGISSNNSPPHPTKDKQASNPSTDLMKLRQQVLLSQLGNHQTVEGNQERACKPLQLLEAAVGNAYTNLVEELLFSTLRECKKAGGKGAKEKENTLDLELKARNTIQKIYNAI